MRHLTPGQSVYHYGLRYRLIAFTDTHARIVDPVTCRELVVSRFDLSPN